MSTSEFTTKRCTKCGNIFPVTSEFWYKSKTGRFGFHAECKPCAKIRDKERYDPEKRRDSNRAYRKKNLDRLRSHAKEYRENNKEIIATRKKKYAQENKDKVNEYHRKYRTANPDRHKQYDKKRSENRKEYRKQYSKIYNVTHREHRSIKRRLRYLDNKERENENARNRRAKKQQAGGTYTEKQIQALYEKQNGCCFHCNIPLNGIFHRDHWIPLDKGGDNWIENIRLLCPTCNLSKAAKLPCEWDSQYCE